MANYIVGDIQGCFNGLMALLDKARFCQQRDTLWSVGDLIGRGHQAEQTLTYLHSLGDSFKTVLGNHDLHFLAVSQGLRKTKSDDRFEDLLAAANSQLLIDWLRQQPLARQFDKNTLICHAGLYPHWSFENALKYSQRISKRLSDERWHSLLQSMYTPTSNHWHKDLSGVDKNNFIINAFTRMRFLEPDLALNLHAKGDVKNPKDQLKAWFNITNPNLKNKQKIIFGHWAALNGQTNIEQIIGLDTGYIWGNKLTLLHYESGQLISVKNKENASLADNS